jgi:POT family proton-dependent oligopeptide transporter
LKIYPNLRRAGVNFSALKKITAGFATGAAAMIWAAGEIIIHDFFHC